MEEQIHLTDSSDRRTSAWDIKNAPRNYASLVLAQGGSAFFSFASVWLLTRVIGPEGYGGVVAVISASMLVQVLVNWTVITVVRFGVDEFVETGKIARIFWSRFLIAIPNALLVIVTYPLWFPLLADWLKLSPELTWPLLAHFSTAILWMHMQYALQAIKLSTMQGFFMMLERLFIFVSLAILLSISWIGVIPAIFSYALVPLLMTGVTLVYMRRSVFVSFTVDRKFWREIFLYSFPLLPTAMLFYLTSGQADAIFISKFLSTESLGVYAVAWQINGVTLQLPTLANALLLPLFVSLQKEVQMTRLNNYFRNILPTLMMLWGLFCTTGAFLSYFLVPPVFGSEFSPVAGVLWILLPVSVLHFPLLAGYSSLANATSATKISFVSAFVASLANIAFNILLIPIWGLEGCSWATALMFVAGSGTYAMLLRDKISGSIPGTLFSVIPAISAAICFFITRNPWVSFAVCITLTFLVAYFFKVSIKSSFSFFKSLSPR